MVKLHNLDLAMEWDAEPSKGLFGKRTWFHCLASDAEAVVVYIEVFPKRGIRLHVSPPEVDFEDCDLLYCATSSYAPGAIESMKALGDLCYAEWRAGRINDIKEWIHSNAPDVTLLPYGSML